MSTRMMAKERERFNKQVLNDKKDGWDFEVWEEKHHDCCVVCVVRKDQHIAREYRYPVELLSMMIATWHKGIPWLEKELNEANNTLS